MNKIGLKVGVLAIALAFTAGCGKKAPKDIPPPPMGTEGEAGQDQAGDTGVGTEILPGSRADFLRSVPSDRILFETDSYSVDDQDRVILDAQAAWLQRNPNVRVTIEGHADERGTREYNLALGDRRANAAKNYLQNRGIAASRMTVISWGKERPEALGSDETAWAQNRRSVTVLPQ
ncbi:peptidoglycan-associated lipoprotein Pal [Sphingosinicella rhizophila]|uniref:Peptidoglycan-associated lipoprotein n=1 Tax=Sphingosinicella rhizophila TaxID=3050082 RepID=A0ABU3QCA9_9SPHN|nr:peptidoglycan-associated lipoprotein Pal [Sphingosinicella sp. GR2756]MDT9600917.1 peptidoglycan-associated lipoprotein Pal [Sphingosinicella sp. GR2756]